MTTTKDNSKRQLQKTILQKILGKQKMTPSTDLENGFVRIANDLMDAVARYPFTSRQYAIVMAVIRKTYGYGKKQDDISLSQLEQATGQERTTACKSVNGLVLLNVLTKSKGTFGQVLGINKHYRTWQDWEVSWEHWNKGDKQEIQQPKNDYQEQPTATIKPKKEPKPKAEKYDWRSIATPDFINRTAWEKWNTERESSRRSVSEFTLNATIEGMARVHAAGGDVTKAMVSAIGWSSFNAEWALKAQGIGEKNRNSRTSISDRVANMTENFNPDSAVTINNKAGSIESTCIVIPEHPAQIYNQFNH